MLVQEESQRLHTFVVSLNDPTTLYLSNMQTRKKWFNGVCDYCKVKGHKRESCYKLIGFPPNFKFTKCKSTGSIAYQVGSTKLPSGSSSTSISASLHSAPVLTSEQYQQILNLLKIR
ncbi:hypothetical protein V6Z12_A11G168200 [Gossypium hirsutum]